MRPTPLLLIAACLVAACSRSDRKPAPPAPAPSAAAVPDQPDFPTISDLLTRYTQTEDEAVWKPLRDRLIALFPAAVPSVLKIAADPKHPGSISAIRFLSCTNRGPHEAVARTFIGNTLADPAAERRAAAIFVLYDHPWPEATADRLLATWRDDPSPAVRAQVIESAAAWRPLTPELWQLIATALADPDDDVRGAACEGLEGLHSEAQPHCDDLVAIYQASQHADARVAILTVLADCTLDFTKADFLKKIVAGPVCPEQMLALRAMLALPPATPGLLAAALPSLRQTEYIDVQEAAAMVVAHQRPVTPEQLTTLVEAARAGDYPSTRNAAFHGLEEMGPAAVGAVGDLVKMLNAMQGRQDEVIATLFRIQPDHSLVASHLRKSLASGDLPFKTADIIAMLDAPTFAAMGAELLEYVGKNGPPHPTPLFLDYLLKFRHLGALPAPQRQQLATAMGSFLAQSAGVNDCGEACQVLQVIGPDAVAALPQLKTVLQQHPKGGYTAYQALHALARIGPAGIAAMPEVEAFLKHDDLGCLAAAVTARLDAACLPEVLKILREAIASDGGHQRDAVIAAAYLGPPAKDLLPAITQIAGESDHKAAFLARVACGTIGDAEPVVQSFMADLRSPDTSHRIEACYGLVYLQKFAAPAVPALTAAMRQDPDNGAYYAGAIYEITRVRHRGVIRGFNNTPGGYPW